MIDANSRNTSDARPLVQSWRDVAFDRPTVLALGNFDGVHLGHHRILEALRMRAKAHHLEPVALTFEPHPRQFLFPDAKTSLLTAPREKTALIAAEGITVVTLAFDADLAALSAEDFATDVLIRRLRGQHFFLGDDHRFGRSARGNAALLRTLGTPDCVTAVPPAFESGELVSSSTIRHHLKDGNVLRANTLLGRPYSLSGTVVTGSARGRTLGFPTANLRPEDPRKILPFGVFGGYALLADGSRHPAVANIGLRPTFHDAPPEPSVEIHLLDWSGSLYDLPLTFEFHHFVRPERKFDGLDSLKAQIVLDVETWRNLSNS
jgi:riboflavin kinase/FMN adenylyltransferase